MTKASASQHTAAVAQTITGKVQAAIDAYRADWQQARQQAAAQVETASREHPQHAEQLQGYLRDNDFKAITALTRQLQQGSNTCALKTLTEQLSQPAVVEEEEPLLPCFEQTWLKQNRLATEQNENTVGNTEKPELKSLKQFRDSLAKEHAEQRVADALANKPENAGPLNPEMLAIRSLATIRDLSPDYLNRFVAYMDTLLWLEQAASSKPRKKPKSTTA